MGEEALDDFDQDTSVEHDADADLDQILEETFVPEEEKFEAFLEAYEDLERIDEGDHVSHYD